MTDDQLQAEETFQQRSIALTEEYSNELEAYVDERVPPVLDNTEYAARCSSLLIALTRQLARAAAAMGQANGQDELEVRTVVMGMFNRNYDRALKSLAGEGSTVQ